MRFEPTGIPDLASDQSSFTLAEVQKKNLKSSHIVTNPYGPLQIPELLLINLGFQPFIQFQFNIFFVALISYFMQHHSNVPFFQFDLKSAIFVFSLSFFQHTSLFIKHAAVPPAWYLHI